MQFFLTNVGYGFLVLLKFDLIFKLNKYIF